MPPAGYQQCSNTVERKLLSQRFAPLAKLNMTDNGAGESSQAKRSHIDKGELSLIDTALKASGYLLATKIGLQDGAGSTGTSRSGHTVLIATTDLPVSSTHQLSKFRSLYLKCLEHKVDRLQFSISCYTLALGSCPEPTWCKGTWQSLVRCAQEVAAEMALNGLIEAASISDEDDLWTTLYGQEATNTTLVRFLEQLSGWLQDGTQCPPALSQQVFFLAKESHLGRSALTKMVKAGGQVIKSHKKVEELLVKYSGVLAGVDKLFTDVCVVEVLSAALFDEVLEAKKGNYFETSSCLSGLLSVTMVIDKLDSRLLKEEKYGCFLELRNFPRVSMMDSSACASHLQDGFHGCQRTVMVALKKMLKSSNRNKVLSWMAAVVSLNELRAGPRFRKEGVREACSDGFFLNFCSVLLLLCQPFIAGHDPSGEKLGLIDHTYTTSPGCRLDQINETCLAHGVITLDRTSEGHTRFLGVPAPGSGVATATQFKFVTECFFMTQRALHVGLIPAMNTFSQVVSDLGRQLQAERGSGGTEEESAKESVLKNLYVLYQLAWSCSLLDPEFVQLCCEFYITQAVWITRLIESCQQGDLAEAEVHQSQQQLLSGLPEFCVKDMASWFRFVALHRPKLLQGLQLAPMVDCCVGLLERPDLLPDPLAQSRIVSTLLVFVDSDKRGVAPQRLLGAENWGGILGELSAMVQGNPSVRDNLGPALLHTYAAVSVFEGLDVDKENFDKFTTRYEVTQLLQRLWARQGCKESILRECGKQKFQSFLGAILDTLLYQLGDALSRLVNVKSCEVAKEGGQWKSLSERKRKEKERFLSSEQRASRGFMTQASKQLDLLFAITEAEQVSRCLSLSPLGKRTAATMLGFLNTLCGPNASNLKVKDMEKYLFDPTHLVVQISSILVRVWVQDDRTCSAEEGGEGFLTCLAAHPDLSLATMAKCGHVLQMSSTGEARVLAGFTALTEKLQTVVTAADEEAFFQSTSSSSHPDLDPCAWQAEADASIVAEEDLRVIYMAALEDSKFDGAELSVAHTLQDKAQVALDPRSPLVRTVMRDMRQLQEASLVHPDSAIFVRQDEDHLDLVRVLITGPTDTPYSRGCFVFDINYPASFPNNPPLVVMTTTGGGTVRFNPNLYADGKVCLSLLGTWHGGDASEKWDPAKSNLLQVLLSIQGMILIPDPMFNEPGYEAIKGSPEGNARSKKYDADIQVYTIRYAMLEQLRNPPKGFEDLIPVHFALQREVILKQCSRWLRDAISPQHEQKLRKAINELRAEMDKI